MFVIFTVLIHAGKCKFLVFQYDFTKPLEDVKVFERENAVFACEVTHKNVPVTWYINSVEVVPSVKYQVLSEGTVHRLVVGMVKPEDEVEVKAVFHEASCTARLQVESKSCLIFVDLSCLSHIGSFCHTRYVS